MILFGFLTSWIYILSLAFPQQYSLSFSAQSITSFTCCDQESFYEVSTVTHKHSFDSWFWFINFLSILRFIPQFYTFSHFSKRQKSNFSSSEFPLNFHFLILITFPQKFKVKNPSKGEGKEKIRCRSGKGFLSFPLNFLSLSLSLFLPLFWLYNNIFHVPWFCVNVQSDFYWIFHRFGGWDHLLYQVGGSNEGGRERKKEGASEERIHERGRDRLQFLQLSSPILFPSFLFLFWRQPHTFHHHPSLPLLLAILSQVTSENVGHVCNQETSKKFEMVCKRTN